jgi:hypothetical protein
MFGILGPIILIFILSSLMKGYIIRKYNKNTPKKVEYKYRPVNALSLLGEDNLIKQQNTMFSTYFKKYTEYDENIEL